MDEDWLDADAPNQGGTSDPLTSREYDRLASRYSDAGYREGITDGKLSTLQEGFDQSFSQSVEAAQKLGNLRGRAAALLSFHTSSLRPQNPTSRSQAAVEELRDLLRELNRVKRDDILPKDLEREIHEKEEHADGDRHGEGEGFELEYSEKREMEGLENALASIGNEGKREEGVLREGKLLDHLESCLAKIENELRASKSA